MVIFRPRGVKKGNQATAAELEVLFGVADVEECTRVILEDHVLRARNRTASDKAAGPKGQLAWHAVCGTCQAHFTSQLILARAMIGMRRLKSLSHVSLWHCLGKLACGQFTPLQVA
jgi:hypothetical protein